MNILIASNNNYIFPTAVMLKSLLLNNSLENLDVYFLYSNVYKCNLKYLKRVFEEYGEKSRARLHFCFINQKDFDGFPISHHFSIEAYYRLMAADIIPKTEDRVLWIDVDTIVKKNLSELYYQDFEDKLIAVCSSINKNPQEQLDRLGCPEGTTYFNSGMILFNLKGIRENNIKFENYCDFFEKNKNRILWLDQDILNGFYALRTKVLDYKLYNYQMFSEAIFDEEEIRFIDENTVILHYIGAKKPWHSDYKNCCKSYWKDYARSLYRTEHMRRFYEKINDIFHKIKS